MFGRSLRGSVAGTHDVTPSAQVVPVQRSPPGQRPMDGTGRPVASCSGQQGGTVPELSCDAEYKVAGGSHGTTRQRALIASAIAEADMPVTASTRNARARTIGQGLRADAAACQRKSCVDGKRRRGVGAARWLPFTAGPHDHEPLAGLIAALGDAVRLVRVSAAQATPSFLNGLPSGPALG